MTTNGRQIHGDTHVRLPEVQEGQASPEVRAIFDEIARTVRVPFVGLFWRVLASDPPVLRLAWDAVAPNLRTHAAEAAADTLRRRALIVEAAEISSHKAFKGDLVRAEIDYDLRTRIGNFNHIAYYALPKHLLAVTMLAEAMESSTGATDKAPNSQPAAAAPQSAEIPLGIVAGAVPVAPVDPESARGKAAELLPRIAAEHGHPTAEDYFRSLARLPDYLNAAWNAIRPIVRDEEYDARGRELVALARDAARRMPHPVPFPAGRLSPPQVGEMTQLLRLFRDRILPDTLMDAALVTALTDGPAMDGGSPFPLP